MGGAVLAEGSDVQSQSALMLNVQTMEKTAKTAQAVEERAADEAERVLRSLAAASDDVRATRASARAVAGYQAQAAEALRLAFGHAQRAEGLQQAQAYQEANATNIVHQAVQQLQGAPPSIENLGLMEKLRQAEAAQSAAASSASYQDEAFDALRSTMLTAAQAATTAKDVQETQASPTLRDALDKLQVAEGVQVQHARQDVQLAQTLGFVANDSTKLSESARHVLEAEEQRIGEKLTRISDKLNKAEAKSVYLEEELAKASRDRTAVQGALVATQQAQLADHRAAEDARRRAAQERQEASTMLQAASATQSALQKQAANTASYLLNVGVQATQAAQQLQSSLGATPAR